MWSRIIEFVKYYWVGCIVGPFIAWMIVTFTWLMVQDIRREIKMEKKHFYSICLGYRDSYECESYEMTKDVLTMKLSDGRTETVNYPMNVRIDKVK